MSRLFGSGGFGWEKGTHRELPAESTLRLRPLADLLGAGEGERGIAGVGRETEEDKRRERWSSSRSPSFPPSLPLPANPPLRRAPAPMHADDETQQQPAFVSLSSRLDLESPPEELELLELTAPVEETEESGPAPSLLDRLWSTKVVAWEGGDQDADAGTVEEELEMESVSDDGDAVSVPAVPLQAPTREGEGKLVRHPLPAFSHLASSPIATPEDHCAVRYQRAVCSYGHASNLVCLPEHSTPAAAFR